jgi:exopolysaccharide biosynthesis polyprenyl glycosylphosphotransferase
MSTSAFLSESPIKPLITRRWLAIALLVGDAVGLGVSVSSALWFHSGQRLDQRISPVFGGVMLVSLIGLYLVDAYRPESQIKGVWVSARIVICTSTIALLGAALIYLFGTWAKDPLLERSVLWSSLVLFTLWAILLRWRATVWVQSWTQSSRWLLLGGKVPIASFIQDFSTLNPMGRLVVLAEDSDPVYSRSQHWVGNLKDLSTWSFQSWSGIIINPQIKLTSDQVRRLMQLRLRGTSVYGLLDFYEAFHHKLPSTLLSDSWFVSSSGYDLISSRISLKIKRVTDIVLTIVLLIICFPVMLLAALAIRFDSPGPVFYSQTRSGLNRRPFVVYKFRSMYQDAEKRGAQWAQERDPRITRVGRWLRLLRIDELPQIWNVLRGDMSLIGPRPERPEFDTRLAAKIPYYDVRYLVKPGITGWAQVMYPYGASVQDACEKLAYDLYYIKNYSLWLEWAIVVKTMRVVLLGKGR